MSSASLDAMHESRSIHAWDYLPLSEPRVVMQLIRSRSR